MRVVAPLILGLCAHGALLSSGDQCGPINKGIQQLVMVHGKMGLDLKMTEQENDKYGCWFNRFKKWKNELITNSTAGIEDESANALSSRKAMAGAEANVENWEAKVAEHTASLDKAIQERSDTETECANTQHELKTLNGKLKNALNILNKAKQGTKDAQQDEYDTSAEEKGQTEASMNAFLQKSTPAKFAEIFSDARVSKLSADQRVAIKSFMQAAKQNKYGFQSDVIVGIIDSMVDDTNADHDRSVTSCKEALCNDDMDGCGDSVGSITESITNLGDAIKQSKKSLADSTKALTESSDEQKRAEEALAAHTKTLEESKVLLAEEEATYRQHQREFSEHVKLAKGEMDAVDQARVVLMCLCECKGDGASKKKCQVCPKSMMFMQLSEVSKVEDARKSLSKFLAARVGKNFALAQLYAEVTVGGRFDAIVTHVQKMQSDLREEMRVDKNEYNQCNKNIADNKSTHTATSTSKAGAEKNIAFHTAQIAKLTAGIEENENNIADQDADMAAVANERAQANKTYKKVRSENQDATNAMDKAIGILADYYKNNLKEGRFLQMGKPAKYAIDKNKSYKKDVKKYEKKSGIVFDILNQIKTDIAREMDENKAAEVEAQAAFQKGMDERQAQIDEWNGEIDDMKIEKTNQTLEKSANEKIRKQAKYDLENPIEEQKNAIANSCGWMMNKDTYRNRVKKQEDNMTMLKYTVCVLRGGTDADCGGLA